MADVLVGMLVAQSEHLQLDRARVAQRLSETADARMNAAGLARNGGDEEGHLHRLARWIGFAGTPAAIVLSGSFFVRTAPAPRTECAPKPQPLTRTA